MSENGYDISGAINARTNELLAAHIGNIVIAQAQGQGAADVLGKELQHASALVGELQAKKDELSGRIQELETDLANAEARAASKPGITLEEACAVISEQGGYVNMPVAVD